MKFRTLNYSEKIFVGYDNVYELSCECLICDFCTSKNRGDYRYDLDDERPEPFIICNKHNVFDEKKNKFNDITKLKLKWPDPQNENASIAMKIFKMINLQNPEMEDFDNEDIEYL